jgi:UDP-glucose 4-epimerase
VYGPRQDALGEGGVVAIFCHRAAAGEPLTVNGDGTQTRDFVFVGDLVSAIATAIEFEGMLGLEEGSAYNISTGIETSVNDLVETLTSACACDIDVHHGPEREGDVARSALDPSRALRVFGWRADTPLAEGLRATWDWFSSAR